jgi:lathosterol oxidase
MLTDFPFVWPIIFGIDLARYAVAASLMSLFLLAWRRRLAGRKIRPAEPDPGRRQKRAEIAASLRTVVVFSLFGFAIYLGKRNGVIPGYSAIEDFGWLYFACSIALAVIAQDAWFYWTHRAMHHPRLFRLFHRTHHRSVHPSPWTAYAFDVPEAIVQATFLPLFLYFVPMHDAAIFVFLTHMIVRNVMGHCGYELFPRRLADSRALGWNNGITHHDLHHERFRWNYGFYFTWWDRWMGTEHPEYRARLRRAGLPVAAFLLMALPLEDLKAEERLLGEWATQGFSAKVRIARCGERLCGRVTWLWDPAQRERVPLGTEIVKGFVRAAPREWSGSIYNPEDGRTYDATMRLGPEGELRLEGCALAIFCQTQVWRRPPGACAS